MSFRFQNLKHFKNMKSCSNPKKKKGKKKCKKKCSRGPYCYYGASGVTRLFRDQSVRIRSALGRIQQGPIVILQQFTPEDVRYRNFNYNGSFSKSLEHDSVTGALTATSEYEKLVRSLFRSDQSLLNDVQLAPGAVQLLVNPTAAFSSVLQGAPQNRFELLPPPTLSSATSAAEMVEIYAQAVARDVAFVDYSTDAIITSLLGATRLNDPGVTENLIYTPLAPFTPQTIFRGDADGCILGPYVSQLLLLDVPTSHTGSFPQRYTTYLPRFNDRVEWGVNSAEMISIQNGIPTGSMPALDTNRYIYNGRTLAEAVHNDSGYQYYYQSALILLYLGAPLNPDFPEFANQSPFITGSGMVNIITALAGVSRLAFQHAWYWKWIRFRKLRPEAYSLWIHNVVSNTVENSGNYDISSVVLDNDVLGDIEAINAGWGFPGNWTLPLCYREGSPVHPSAPQGHFTVASACATVLKMFFECDVLWTDLQGLVEANASGDTLVPYTGDTTSITVGTEINKLAYNVGLGRNWAGVHYRSDMSAKLGEEVAKSYMSDLLATLSENNLPGNTPPMITFRNFAGEIETVGPSTLNTV